MIVLLIIIAVIFLFCMIRVGADVDYTAGNLTLSATVCGVKLQLYPKEDDGKEKKPKKEKKKKEKKPKPEEEQPQEEQGKKKKFKMPLDLNKDEILGLLKKVLKGLGKFRKMKVDRFKLDVLMTGDDPYSTAVSFGYLNAALSSLGALCSSRFTVKDCYVHTAVDFMAEESKYDAGIALSIRIGQILGIVNTILFGALGILIKNRIRVKKEKKSAAKEQPAEAIPEQTAAQQTAESENLTITNTESERK